MPRIKDFYRQLKQRRVIRTAVVYVALVWGALQVAELLDDAGFMTEQQVQWLIFAALVGFPVTLALSWFFEMPWRDRKGIAILGDVAVILAVVIGISLLAWQHYFRSFARPVLAILKIEATDVNPDTPALGDYLAGRLRMLLATRPQIRVIDLASSHHPVLRDLSITDRASMLGADLLLSGTVNQSEDHVRLGLQLYDARGELVWSEQFEDRLLDQAQMQSAVLTVLWDQIPLPPDALPETRRIVSSCEYPPDPEAIRMLFRSNRDGQIDQLTALIGAQRDNGLLHLARSLAFFAQAETAPPPRRPVISNLALQDLNEASRNCPDHPEINRQRLLATRILQDTAGNYESYLAEFPSDAQIRRMLSDAALKNGNPEAAAVLAREAWLIDPLSDASICHYDRISRATGKNNTAANFRTAVDSTRPDLELPCP